MIATVLPELTAASVEFADRLVRLSAEADLDPAEAEYILASGFAAIQRVSKLWPIVRDRIGGGTTAATAVRLLAPLQNSVNKNLSLAEKLKKIALVFRARVGHEPEAGSELNAAETRLREIQAEIARLLNMIDSPPRWPAAEQLRKAKESMQQGDRLTAEEFRRTILDE